MLFKRLLSNLLVSVIIKLTRKLSNCFLTNLYQQSTCFLTLIAYKDNGEDNTHPNLLKHSSKSVNNILRKQGFVARLGQILNNGINQIQNRELSVCFCLLI